MVDPLTTNVGLAVPIRGSDVGTWDLPVNGDFTLIDSMLGGVTTLALSSAPVTLATSQAQNSIIRLTGTLIANVAITLPSIYKFWTIDNQITNSPQSGVVTLVSTSGASIIGCPPGTQDVFYDGTTVNYRNLGNIGEYWDYAGSGRPLWVSQCTKPPYLVCDGTAFSSATYPVLANLLGTTTLPDSRGRNRFSLNSGTGRLTTAGAGIDGNTIAAAGGGNGLTLTSSYVPTLTSVNGAQAITVSPNTSNKSFPTTAGTVTNSGPSVPTTGGIAVPYTTAGGGDWQNATSISGNNSISVTYTNASPANITALTPGYVGGITMIRAA